MQKVRFWDPDHWRFRAEETRTVADQMTHEEARAIMRRIALTTTVSLSLPRSNSFGKQLNEKLEYTLLALVADAVLLMRSLTCPKNCTHCHRRSGG
jgi:L-lysine 2,3-aminomutase